MRIRYALAVVVLVAGLAVTLAIARPQTFWTTDGRDLAESLERAGDGFAVLSCRRAQRSRWICPIEDDPGSGPSDEYHVTLGSDDCWRGARAPDSYVAPNGEPLAGCLQLLDYLWP